MKKYFAMLFAAAFMTAALTACGGNAGNNTANNGNNGGNANAGGDNTGDAAFTTVEEGKLVMATNAQFPPYEMVDDNGNVIGIDAEIAAAIAEKLNLELQIDDMDFDSALMAVQQGSADVVLAGLSYREDRDQVLDFTSKYATGVQVVIVKDGSDVTMDNLGEKMIGTQRGTTGYLYASDTPENGGYGEDHVLGYDNGALAVQALVDGAIDAVIIDQAPAEAYVAANEGLTILPGNWVEEDYCIAVNEGNTALLDAVQTALDELTADGTIDSIISTYITAE